MNREVFAAVAEALDRGEAAALVTIVALRIRIEPASAVDSRAEHDVSGSDPVIRP